MKNTTIYLSIILASISTSCSIVKDPILITYIDKAHHSGSEINAGGNVGEIKPSINPASNSASNASLKERLEAITIDPNALSIATPASAVKTAVIEACDRLVQPVIGQIPRLTQAEIQTIASSPLSYANAQLIDELEKVYKYANNKTIELRTAFNKQSKSCHKVTIVIE